MERPSGAELRIRRQANKTIVPRMHTDEPGSRAFRPPKKSLTRRCGAAEDVREVLKIPLRSLRSLRLKILLRTSSATQYGFRLRRQIISGTLDKAAASPPLSLLCGLRELCVRLLLRQGTAACRLIRVREQFKA